MTRALLRLLHYTLTGLLVLIIGTIFYAVTAKALQTVWMTIGGTELEGWYLHVPVIIIIISLIPGRVRRSYEAVPARPPAYYPGTTEGISYAGAIHHQVHKEDQ